MKTTSDAIKRAAAECGFDLAGIAPVDPSAMPELAQYAHWIDAGHAGEMDYLKSRDDHGRLRREAVAHAAPWARSVLVCALNYNTAHPYSTECSGPEHGWISRYAWGAADYHDVLLPRLRRLEEKVRAVAGADIQMRSYVDTGPLVERVYAKYAGIGWIGKNTCILNQRLGSWLFLGVVLTSLELAPDLPPTDRCGSCTRCLDVCPTDAFVGPYQLDASRCISYLTIEKRGDMPNDLRAGVGRHVFGCDLCQDVCPWNRRAPATAAPEFQPRDNLVNPALEWLAGVSEEEFRQNFRSSPVKRAKRTGLRRNAVIAMGNSGDRRFVPQLCRLAEDPDPVVAEHARWALQRLQSALDSPAATADNIVCG